MPRRRERSSWTDYVRSVVDPDERQIDIARRTGIDQTTVSRWLSDAEGRKTITSQAVAKFARAYDRPVIEAFVVAGFLTEEEAGYRVDRRPVDLQQVSDHELLEELRLRLGPIAFPPHPDQQWQHHRSNPQRSDDDDTGPPAEHAHHR